MNLLNLFFLIALPTIALTIYWMITLLQDEAAARPQQTEEDNEADD